MRLDPRRAVAAVRELDRPIIVLAAITFISQVGVSVMLPLLPLFAIELGATPRELGLMVSIFAVTQTVGQLGSGVLSALALAAPPAAPRSGGVRGREPPHRDVAGRPAAHRVPRPGGLRRRPVDHRRAAVHRACRRPGQAGLHERRDLGRRAPAGPSSGPAIGGFLALSDLRIPFIVVGITATVAGISAILFLPPEPGHSARDRPRRGSGRPPDAPAVRRVRLREQIAAIRPLGALALWNLGFSAAYGGWITTFGPYASDRLGLPVNQVTLIFAMFGLGSIFIGPWLSRRADRAGGAGWSRSVRSSSWQTWPR